MLNKLRSLFYFTHDKQIIREHDLGRYLIFRCEKSKQLKQERLRLCESIKKKFSLLKFKGTSNSCGSIYILTDFSAERFYTGFKFQLVIDFDLQKFFTFFYIVRDNTKKC